MAITTYRPLPQEIRDVQAEMEAVAAGYGLDFFETIFEMLDYEELSMFAAYGGFPIRYPHWRFGAEFDELIKGYSYGLQKIYEMVINTDPCYAYLLSCNSMTDQKLVIAHVYGHCDFFKNNAWFGPTNRKMLDQMANHAARVNRYIDTQGYEPVEQFIDACLSLDDLIDPHAPHIVRRDEDRPKTSRPQPGNPESPPERPDGRFRAKDYMEGYINPPSVLAAESERQRLDEETRRAERKFPDQPQRDVLLFLLEHAPLQPWQHDVLSIVRDEAYYFAPQGQTKIMNEGWACVAADTSVVTADGLQPMRQVVERQRAGEAVQVWDGDSLRDVTDAHVIEDHETVTVRTDLGVELTGSANHRVLLDDGETWRRLDELSVGDVLAIGQGGAARSSEEPGDALAIDVARLTAWLVRFGHAAQRHDDDRCEGWVLPIPSEAFAPEVWDAVLGECPQPCRPTVTRAVWESHPVGAGAGSVFDGALPDSSDGVGWRVGGEVGRRPSVGRSGAFFESFAEDLDPPAAFDPARHALPEQPAAFEAFAREMLAVDLIGFSKYRPYLEIDGPSDLLRAFWTRLLAYGVVTRFDELFRRPGEARVLFDVAAMEQFDAAIGFGHDDIPEEIRRRLAKVYPASRPPRWINRVVHLERGRTDVYDITVESSHRYAAAGLINHNSYWHSTIMTRHGLTGADLIDYADHHSGTMAMSPTRLNPYKIGIELFREIEERWDKGQFGPDWESCDDTEEKARWDTGLGQGRDKIFEVRKVHNDVTFIDTFLTEDFCRKHKLFSFAYNESTDHYEIASREFAAIKRQLLTSLTNHGRPRIHVVNGNGGNRGELVLEHEFEGVELKLDYARATLANLHRLWQRPVEILTVVDDVPSVIRFDGTDHTVAARV